MLNSALEHYRSQQQVTALAVREVRRRAGTGPGSVARAVASYQLAAAQLTFQWAPAELAEQGLAAHPVARPNLGALLTPADSVIERLAATDSAHAVEQLVRTLVQDAGRTAATVDLARRPELTGHVRSLNLPSCSRCVVLAGRVYRYSEGFQRHPRCDCLMTLTTQASGRDLVTDPLDAVASGKVHGLSRGDMEALDAGANLAQVVNVQRKAAGLKVGSSVIERGSRLTPQGVMRVASDRDDAIRLMKQFGYFL